MQSSLLQLILNEQQHDKMNKMTCRLSLIRVFAVCIKKPWVLSFPLSAKRRLWSECADAQADLSLRWVHKSFRWFSCAAAQIILTAMISNWARSCENMSYAICEQQRRRLACTSAQSDQHVCCSLFKLYDMYTCYIQSFKILVGFCCWTGCFESYLVKNAWKHVFAWCVMNSGRKKYDHI